MLPLDDTWRDTLQINLMYVCARTLIGHNRKLAEEIAIWHLSLYGRKTKSNKDAYNSAHKFYNVKEMAGINSVHIVPTFHMNTLKELAKEIGDQYRDFWTTNQLEQKEIDKEWFRFNMMRNHFDELQKSYENSQRSEKNLLNFIHDSQSESMEAIFSVSDADQEALNNQFKLTIENTNNFANKFLDLATDEAQMNTNMLKGELYNLNQKLERDKLFIGASQQTLSTLNTTMHDYRHDMEGQVDALERDLKVRKIKKDVFETF